MLWHENWAGTKRATDPSKLVKVTRGRFGEEIFSHIRRMVVVKEFHGQAICMSVSTSVFKRLTDILHRPINTYGGKGVSKPGMSKEDREAHAIIYTTDSKPVFISAEKGMMSKKPIVVVPSSPDQRLTRESRLNFARCYSVDWNVKVMDVGTIASNSLPWVISYYRDTHRLG